MESKYVERLIRDCPGKKKNCSEVSLSFISIIIKQAVGTKFPYNQFWKRTLVFAGITPYILGHSQCYEKAVN